MKKDPRVHITFILECIELIEKYTKDKTIESFNTNTQLQDAIVRRIELIGEAVKNVPQEIKDKHQEIPWARIMGMRNILIHDYLGIDLPTTWQVASKEIPILKEKILKIKQELSQEKSPRQL